MATMPCRRPTLDRITAVEAIRSIFAQSSIYRDAVISEPLVGPEGGVILDISFGRDTAFRIVAPTADEAYAILHELAVAMVDTDRRPARPRVPDRA